MFITVVEMDMPANLDRAAVDAAIRKTASRYTRVEGLIRKYYTSKEPKVTGGVFVWESREHAEAAHSDPAWRKIILDGYGMEPRITYYDVRLIVDNETGEIISGSSV